MFLFFKKDDNEDFFDDLAEILKEDTITYTIYSTHDLIYKINNITFHFKNYDVIPILKKINKNLYTCDIECNNNCKYNTFNIECTCELLNITVTNNRSNDLNNAKILVSWDKKLKLFKI
jgi:hypothetical protein